MDKLLWLKDAYTDSGIVGNKARNLAYLLKLGFPVPDGFVGTTILYNAYLGALGNELMNSMLGAKTSQERRDRYEGVRRRISAVDITPSDSDELVSNHRRLGSLSVVRSCSPVEDGEQFNFAGQHDSYLRVTEEGLLDAIKYCWASLFTPRSIVYRKIAGIPNKELSMAVLDQRFVEPRISGVTFTRNPLNGSEELMIEYNEGHNEQIVKGEIIPQRAVERGGSLQIADEKYMSLIRDVAKLCHEVEAAFGSPQDIEWVFGQDDKLYIVQSRPLQISQ